MLFLFDHKYLLPFQIFVYTLRDAISRSNLDVVILTDDEQVERSDFVQRVANRVIRFSGEQLSFLRSIDTSNVPADARHPIYGAYWFLHFLLFDDYGYDFHICLDADMLCMSEKLSFAELTGSGSFSAVPTVGKSRLGLPRSYRRDHDIASAQREAGLQTIFRIARKQFGKGRAINAGLLYIARPLISRRTVEDLVAMASSQTFRLDQDVIAHYIANQKDLLSSTLPLWWNFPEVACYVVGQERFHQNLLPNIRLLHFNKKPKPWNARDDANWLHRLWWNCHDESEVWAADRTRPFLVPQADGSRDSAGN